MTLPAELVNATQWDVGDVIEICIGDGHVELHRVHTVTEEDITAALSEGGMPSFEELEGWSEPTIPVGREVID